MASVGLEYQLRGNYYVVVGIGTCTDTEIEIPREHDGKIVDSIWFLAFQNNTSIISVTFEENSQLTSISQEAFKNCSNLTSIVIPSSVTVIGDYAFKGCSNLTSIIFSNGSLLRSIWNGAFEDCGSLTNMEIPNNVREIGYETFQRCSNLAIVTFRGNQLTSIGSKAFSYCSSLKDVYYDKTISDWCKISFVNATSNPMKYASHFYIKDENSIYVELTEAELNNDITELKSYTFYQINSLISINIPNGVESIGDFVFYNCRNLASVTIGENSQLTTIGSDSFSGCRSLTSIVIPESVTSIGAYAFYDCRNLTSIEIPNNVVSIGEYAFANNGLASVTFKYESQLTSINNNLFHSCSNLISITIPTSVTSVGNYAFYGCVSLERVVFEDDSNLISIGEYAFAYCVNISTLIFGENSKLTSIGQYAFNSCRGLETTTLPSSITTISSSAFANCLSLNKILCYGNIRDWNWNNISIGASNNALINATKYYYNASEPQNLEDTTNYWGYDENNNFIIWNKIKELVNYVVNNNVINDGYKTLIVPIKVNTDYTIYIDSSIPIYIAATYYDGVNILTDYDKNKSLYNIFDYVLKTRCSFNQPFVYRIDKEETFTNKGGSTANETILQNQLVMLIQIPEINTSTVMVLEGNYTENKLINTNCNGIEMQNGIKKLYYGKPLKNIEEIDLVENYFSSVSSLTQIFDGQNYAFNDRLIEYLLLNAITKNDDITDNIKRIQEYISSYKAQSQLRERYTKPYIKGVWDLQMRQYIYNLITQKYDKPIGIDINGFIDKDTESIIEQCKEKK